MQEDLIKESFMKHEMKLHRDPFEKIKQGTKTIELRLYDEKRRAISVGDEIEFTSRALGERLICRVIALHIFDSFEDLYRELPLLRCGYTEQDISTAAPSDMDAYYSREQQSAYGVVGIEIEVINV